MSYLAATFPGIGERHLPVTRDQAMLLLVALNMFMLSLDTYLAHVISGTIRTREWIPIVFGTVAGSLLLLAGLIAIRNRNRAAVLATLVFVAAVIVGVLGAWFHWQRGTLPSAPAGERVSIALLVWAPPVLAPFAFAGVGVLGMIAAWREVPVNSGTIQLPAGRMLHMPYSKTRAYFFLISLGILMALISSSFDHARHWENPMFWIPLVTGVFAMAVAFGAGALPEPLGKFDLYTYTGAMLLMVLVGLLGLFFHVRSDLTANSTFVLERFLRGAPFMSPMLYANMGLFGLLVLLDPRERRRDFRRRRFFLGARADAGKGPA